LFALANGTEASRDLLRIDPRTLLGIGVLVALLSGCVALFAGEPFMTGLWRPHTLVGIGEVGTILLFDIGVYLVVMGTTLLILFTLDEGPST
jgi:multicomponent Na+:H+ antiporter subunit B